MAEERQNADGSVSQVRERDSLELSRTGGYAAPGVQNQQANGPAQPAYAGGSTMIFNLTGGTETGGGILSWKNNLGYDIMVVSHQLDVVLTGSSTATVSAGSATTATGTSSNMLATQAVSSVATLNGGALSVKIAQNNFLVMGNAASGSTTTAFRGRAYITFLPTTTTTDAA